MQPSKPCSPLVPTMVGPHHQCLSAKRSPHSKLTPPSKLTHAGNCTTQRITHTTNSESMSIIYISFHFTFILYSMESNLLYFSVWPRPTYSCTSPWDYIETLFSFVPWCWTSFPPTSGSSYTSYSFTLIALPSYSPLAHNNGGPICQNYLGFMQFLGNLGKIIF